MRFVSQTSSGTSANSFQSSLSAVRAQPTLDKFKFIPKPECGSSSDVSSNSGCKDGDAKLEGALPSWLAGGGPALRNSGVSKSFSYHKSSDLVEEFERLVCRKRVL